LDTVAPIGIGIVAGRSPRRPAAAFEHLAKINRHRIGDTLHYPGKDAHYLYRMITGAARETVLTADGRRQVVDFLLPGDLFGFTLAGKHEFFAEVIAENTTIARYPRLDTQRLMELDSAVEHLMSEAALRTITRLRTHIMLMRGCTAVGKLSGFLLEMAQRSVVIPNDGVALSMSRYDIADYLSVAVETVSRAFSLLRRESAIAVDGPRLVWILDRGALMRRSAVPSHRGVIPDHVDSAFATAL
jgi:CRP/FNR family nitrogen fixation transcriptional regulator